MHYLIGEYLLKTASQPVKYEHDPERTKALVIVETRPSFWLPYVVANALKFNPDFNLYVFGTREVLELVNKIVLGAYAHSEMPSRISINQYSAMLIDETFWSLFKEPHILIFQTDCVFVRSIPTHFFEYDYIGAVCGPNISSFIMNGGLSLRRKDAMLRAIKLMDEHTKTLAEDVAFTQTMKSSEGAFNLPTMTMCNEFAMESSGDPGKVVGMHGTEKFYTTGNWIIEQLLSCPQSSLAHKYDVTAVVGLGGCL